MSPHAMPAYDIDEEEPFRNLAEFAVTKNAFLPEGNPLKKLPDPYYEPWESIAQNLPTLIQSGCIHSAVNEVPLLSIDRLASQAEWRRAYLLLTFIAHAHIWGGDIPKEILPPQITAPLLGVSAHLELPPTLTYAAVCLWNFAGDSHDFTNVQTLRTLVSFTGTESESWFFLISVAMEARAAGILQTMIGALKAVKSRDYQVIIDALKELSQCIQGVSDLLERMYERCDPMTFYHKLRPFLAGTKNMEAAGLPRGVFYDEGDGKGEWRHLQGGSNGQSSLIQFFDLVLGVDHNGGQSFHSQVREYMPGPHRRFLIHVARIGSIRELALAPPVTDQQHRLRDAYTAATDALSRFRDKHIQIVTRYIIIPSRQPRDTSQQQQQQKQKQNLATSSLARKREELTGTGGTVLMPFLRQARDETIMAGKLVRR